MLRVLLVEDDPQVAVTSKAVLEHLGHFVMTATNGFQGLELIHAEQPDVVITDVMMPGMSGLEMVERARIAHYEGSIIVCSAAFERDYLNPRAGHDAFLQKPYRMEEMAALLAKL